MSYILYDFDGNIVHYSDLQHRSVWYSRGLSKEEVFVEKFGKSLGVIINPEKKNNPTLPDLIHQEHYADLKCQNTPLFYAQRNYGVDPQFAVTFNLKDAFNYGSFGNDYPDMTIFFWVEWLVGKMSTSYNNYEVSPMEGVWKASFEQINKIRLRSPIHWYNQRDKFKETNPELIGILKEFEPRLIHRQGVYSIRGVKQNAACSYVFDLRHFEKIE